MQCSWDSFSQKTRSTLNNFLLRNPPDLTGIVHQTRNINRLLTYNFPQHRVSS